MWLCCWLIFSSISCWITKIIWALKANNGGNVNKLGASPIPHYTRWRFRVVVCAYVRLYGVMKGRPGALHDKEAASKHILQQCVKGWEGGRRRDERQTALFSQLPLSFVTTGLFRRRASWSKREFVQSNSILTFLANRGPPIATPTPTRCATACEPRAPPVFRQRRYQHNETEKGQRSNGDKRAIMRWEATHTHTRLTNVCKPSLIRWLHTRIHTLEGEIEHLKLWHSTAGGMETSEGRREESTVTL